MHIEVTVIFPGCISMLHDILCSHMLREVRFGGLRFHTQGIYRQKKIALHYIRLNSKSQIKPRTQLCLN